MEYFSLSLLVKRKCNTEIKFSWRKTKKIIFVFHTCFSQLRKCILAVLVRIKDSAFYILEFEFNNLLFISPSVQSA